MMIARVLSKAVSSSAAAPAADPLNVIAKAFSRAAQMGLPKVAQLYNAIVDAIATGQLERGSKLPGERELSGALGISLGTAQKSLALLAQDGQIVREHGRGSFVQLYRRPLHELWHYRFRDPVSNALLPVYARLLDRRLCVEEGAWSRAIGPDRNGYVQIERAIDVDGRFTCWSLMTLGASRFGRLLEVPRRTIESVNLKVLLFNAFDAPTIAVRHSVRVGAVSGPIAQVVGRAHRRHCLIVEIVALTRRGEPLSFQTIVVPPNEHAMELGTEPSTVEDMPATTTKRMEIA